MSKVGKYLKFKTSGFTLVELLAVIVILGIIVAIVVPSVFSMIKKGKDSSYDILVENFEENARLYATRYRNEVEVGLDTSNYYIIELNDLKEDGLLRTPVLDPRTDDPIDLDNRIIITRETDMSLDVCYENRGCYIPTILSSLITDESNVVSGTTEGLHHDEVNNFYYYRGSNPKNWVIFNDYLWRIVKVHNDGSIKLIFEGKRRGNGTVENGFISTLAFDAGDSNNYNNALTIKGALQDWYDEKITILNDEKVVSKPWCKTGIAYNTSGTVKTTFLSNECTSTTTSNYKIGLLYGSEYLYASLDGNCMTAYKTSGDNGVACKNKNYLYKTNTSYFTMTPTTNSTDVWDVKNTGSLGIPVSADTTSKVRPVINLINGVLADRGDGSLNNPYEVKDIVSVDKDKPVITILGDNPICVPLEGTYTDVEATALDDIDGDLTSNIVTISNVNPNVFGSYKVTYVVSDKSGNRTTAKRTVVVAENYAGPGYMSSKGVNRPVLAAGMIPIKWDDEEEKWIDTTACDSEWYDYSAKKWANARTSDCTTPGNIETCSMWVWIPRYTYKISTGWHTNTAGTIAVQFSMGTDDTRVGTLTLDTGTGASSSNAATNGNKYTNHPAFKFGDTQLTGMWVAKFEASSTNPGATHGGGDTTMLKVKSIPNVTSWQTISNNNIFIVTRAMETDSTYGWGSSGNNIDTHMMKNTEWGAIAYLSRSIYGADTEEIWNNAYNGYKTGCSGTVVDAYEEETCVEYNTSNGVKASTTYNIYGIYDMNGGLVEKTAAYLNNGHDYLTHGASIVSAEDKYKDVYTVGSTDTEANNYALTINHKGDAIYETSNSHTGNVSWFGDHFTMLRTSGVWFGRGGRYVHKSYTGVFTVDITTGHSVVTYGFRPILLVDAEL